MFEKEQNVFEKLYINKMKKTKVVYCLFSKWYFNSKTTYIYFIEVNKLVHTNNIELNYLKGLKITACVYMVKILVLLQTITILVRNTY